MPCFQHKLMLRKLNCTIGAALYCTVYVQVYMYVFDQICALTSLLLGIFFTSCAQVNINGLINECSKPLSWAMYITSPIAAAIQYIKCCIYMHLSVASILEMHSYIVKQCHKTVCCCWSDWLLWISYWCAFLLSLLVVILRLALIFINVYVIPQNIVFLYIEINLIQNKKLQ